MQSAGLRHRNRHGDDSQQTSEATNNKQQQAVTTEPIDPVPATGRGRAIPSFKVDLSVRPQDRYNHIVPEILPHIRRAKLMDIFDDLIRQVLPGLLVGNLVKKSAPMLLRRVYDDEENAELQGIAAATELPMYLLVAFNVLLDLLLGCTSGGVLVEEPEPKKVKVVEPDGRSSWQTEYKSHIVHFRTLDWGMDPLRELVVELNYVRSPGGPVVATTVGYFGYVGVLTGVRKGLSMSLNFRPRHDDSTLRKRVEFRVHQLMVILGLRPSISSVLRRYLLNQPEECPPNKSKGQRRATATAAASAAIRTEDDPPVFDIKTILSELSRSPSTSAYLIFCTPHMVCSCEKDNHVAFVRTSNSFLTTYNHDAADEGDPAALAYAARSAAKAAPTGMEEIVEYSTDRKHALDKIYKRCLRRRRGRPENGGGGRTGGAGGAVALSDVLNHFLNDRDGWIVNEETHYAVVMDPKKGTVLWKRAFEPVPAADRESDVEDGDA